MRILSLLEGLSSLLILQRTTLATPLYTTADHFADEIDKKTIPGTHRLHERRDHGGARRWNIVERADPRAVLPMRIALKQSNVDNAESILLDM